MPFGVDDSSHLAMRNPRGGTDREMKGFLRSGSGLKKGAGVPPKSLQRWLLLEWRFWCRGRLPPCVHLLDGQFQLPGPTLRVCRTQPAFAATRRLGPAGLWLRRVAPGAEGLPSGELCHRQESCLGVVSCPRSRRRAPVRLRCISSAPADCRPACCGR